MAKYIDNNGFAHFLGKLKTLLDGKVNTETGKGLSTNDYTTAEKNKLAGIGANANNYSLPTASADTKGGVKIGAGLTMTGEVLSADVQSVPVMTGATSSAAGAAGLVPAPGAGKQNYFLKGNGEWASVNVTDEHVKIVHDPYSDEKVLLFSAANKSGLSDAGQTTWYSPTSVAGYNEDIYVKPSTGELHATKFVGSGAGLTNVPASALPAASSSAQGAMSSSHYSKLEALPNNATLQATYALKSDITSMYKHKGSVSAVANLPSSGQTAGDVYNVTSTGMNYVWTGSEWDALGEIFTIDAMTTTEIDAAFTAAGLAAA